MHNYREGLVRQIDSELINIISDIEESGPSKEKMREAVLEFHKKLKSLAEEQPE
jgi:hypothetical protein